MQANDMSIFSEPGLQCACQRLKLLCDLQRGTNEQASIHPKWDPENPIILLMLCRERRERGSFQDLWCLKGSFFMKTQPLPRWQSIKATSLALPVLFAGSSAVSILPAIGLYLQNLVKVLWKSCNFQNSVSLWSFIWLLSLRRHCPLSMRMFPFRRGKPQKKNYCTWRGYLGSPKMCPKKIS